MTPPELLIDGKRYHTVKRIGKGGEGEVYTIEGKSDVALKYYTVSDLGEREEKILAMISANLAQKSKFVAFPISIARTKEGKFAGFLMRLVSGHKPLHELYSPVARKQNFPNFDYRHLVHTATNVARALASVHSAGCVVGDINHSGILISEKATVALIDADSFQFLDGSRRYLCSVGVPEYTAPELQGQKLSGIERTSDHDAFALAIVIFQLLMMGRHPFMGSYRQGEMPIQRAISEYRFAYSQKIDSGMMPPPGACALTDFPIEIADTFHHAFAAEKKNCRPGAQNWVSVLEELERSLRRCGDNDLHYVPSVSKSCPWCRMEHRLGTILFLPKLIDIGSSTSSNFEGAQFDLEGIWAKIESIQLPSPTQFQPTLPTLSLSPSEEAKAATSKNNGTQFVGVILLIAAVALVGLQPLLWFVSVGLVWVAWSKAFGGPEVDKGHWQKRFTAVEKKWHDELIAWQKRCGFEELYKCKNKLDSANQEYKDLHGEFQRRLTEHKQNFHASQIRFFLDGYRIRKVKIKGIGAAKEAALASYGIETAADVTSQAVLSVPGFGVVNSKPLLEWRAKLERQFVPAKRSNSNEQLAINKLHREFAEQAAKLRNTLSAGPTNLNSIIQTIRKRTKAVDPVLVRIHKERCQLETDMKFLFITSPVQTTYNSAYTYTPPPSARPQTKPPKSGYGAAQSPRSGKWTSGKISSPSCPQCGDRMVRRTARRGRNAGGNFWGCSQYPSCRGTRPI